MPAAPDSADTRPRATVLGAWLEGWRRAAGARGLTLALWLVMAAVVGPLAGVVATDARLHAELSPIASELLSDWARGWSGLPPASPRVMSEIVLREAIAATGAMATLSRIVFDAPFRAPFLATILAAVSIWAFVSGGIVDRLARARPLGSAAFLALCGGYFFRLLRLGIVAILASWLIFRLLHPLLVGAFFERFASGLADERAVLVARVAAYLLFLVPLGLVSLVVDFARVRLVVEDRRSVAAAVAAAVRFVRRRFLRCAGLYLVNVLVQVLAVRVWLQLASGADGTVWLAVLVAQSWLLVRIWTRIAMLGSEAVFFQGELAHATYTAAPVPRWPESASVEAIRNLRAH